MMGTSSAVHPGVMIAMPFAVTVASGTLRSTAETVIHFPHPWTPGGVTIEAEFTGAHLLHLSAAGCVLNDLYREAASIGVTLDGVRVTAAGDFDKDTWRSTGIEYSVQISSKAAQEDIDSLIRRVDEVAEIPRAIRSGAAVQRSG
jgi:uncharacterized OsmC-like protein